MKVLMVYTYEIPHIEGLKIGQYVTEVKHKFPTIDEIHDAERVIENYWHLGPVKVVNVITLAG